MSADDQIAAESAEWVEAGIISASQREGILEHEASRRTGKQRTYLVAVVAAIGVAVTALGLTLVIASNWEEIPRLVKLGGGVTLMTAAYTGGYWVRGHLGRRFIGEAVILLGPAFFFGNVILVSQQYNIEAHVSWAFLLLFLAVLPLPYLFNSWLHAAALGAALLLWLGTETARDGSPAEFQDGMFLAVGAVSVGVALIALGAAHRPGRYRSLAPSYELAGVVPLFVGLYALGFYRHAVPDDRATFGFIAWFLVAPWIVAITLVSLGAWQLTSGVRSLSPPKLLLPLSAATAVAVAAVGMGVLAGLWPRTGAEESFILYTAVYWVAFVALAAALVWLGAAAENAWWSNTGLVLLGIFVLTRYFDLFAGAGQRGLVFVGSGVLLLAIAFAAERSRRLIEGNGEAPS